MLNKREVFGLITLCQIGELAANAAAGDPRLPLQE